MVTAMSTPKRIIRTRELAREQAFKFRHPLNPDKSDMFIHSLGEAARAPLALAELTSECLRENQLQNHQLMIIHCMNTISCIRKLLVIFLNKFYKKF